MLIVLFVILFTASAYSQETYVSNENSVSVSSFWGRYNNDNKWGITCSYALKGFLQLSYTRSSVLMEEHVDNFQNEYFMRLYMPQQKQFFISIGCGYIYQRVATEPWNGFPVMFTSQGIGLEGGIHLASEDSKTRRIVVSLFYMYYRPHEEMQTPTIRTREINLARSFSADVAVVYYLGQAGLVIGPRIALDSDFRNVFMGLHVSFLLRH